MNHVTKIKVLQDHRTLKEGFEFNCSSINLLVGDQGSGKSTLLGLLRDNSDLLEISLSDYCLTNGVSTFFFDAEKDNPRMKDPQLYTNPNGTDKGIGYTSALISRFQSHGEIIRDFVITPLIQANDCVMFIDEPESGLSIRNQFKFINEIKEAVERNVQFFIATHSLPLIQSINEVISLEHQKIMSSLEFIETQKL